MERQAQKANSRKRPKPIAKPDTPEAVEGRNQVTTQCLALRSELLERIAADEASCAAALQLAEEVCRKQEAKVEKGPNHDECKMIFETRRGFEQLDEIDEANRKKKGGKGGKKAASSA